MPGRAAISVRAGPSANLLWVRHAAAVVVVLRTSVARSLGRVSLSRVVSAPVVVTASLAILGRARMGDGSSNAIAAHLGEPLTRPVGTLMLPAEALMRLAEILTRLARHAARLALGARARLSEPLTPSCVRTLPAVVDNRRLRASDFRRCYPAPGLLLAVRPRIGSAPAASLLTVNLPCSAFAFSRQTNCVWTAV